MAAQFPVQASSPLDLLDSVPGLRQLILLVGLAAAVAVGLGVVLWSQQGPERVLYSNLTERDAAEIVSALESASIPYSYEIGSGVIRVPPDEVHSARLLLASEGLPSGAGVGFEMFQDSGGMTESQFMESARYQRALEIELQRTIASVSAVRGARVHLAIPRQTVFVRERRPASASVLLELHPGRRLEPAQVNAIVNLVAASVPDMERSQVSVIDSQGTLLSAERSGNDLDGVAGDADRHVQRLEERLARRVEDLLTPIVGMGRVRAQVAVHMDFSNRQETQELFDPDNTVIRSEQSSEDLRALLDPARGVPGALSNQPLLEDLVGIFDRDEDQASVPLSRQSLRNFEVGRTIRHIQSGPGELRRLSVAVVVDQPRVVEEGETLAVPYSDEEIQRMTQLVREAVGFDAARGDSVSVVNAAFRPIDFDADMTVDTLSFLDRIDLMGILRIAASVVIVLLLILLVVRPLVRSLAAPQPLRTLALPGAGAGGMGALTQDGEEFEEEADAPPRRSGNYEESLTAARSVASQDPKRAANVVKQWVNEGG